MRTSILLALGASAIAMTACAPKDAPTDAPDAAPAATAEKATMQDMKEIAAATPAVVENAMPEDTQATAFGKGALERADGKLASFEFDANYTSSGAVTGRIDYTVFLDEGKIELNAKVTCGHYDMTTKRAWVGGEVKANRSNHAEYKDGRFAVGQPVWFRFEESETHPDPAAQISDLRFAGDDGFDNAKSFCDEKPWSTDGLTDLSSQGAVIIFALPDTAG
ncbi:MAG: hypothetical protein AB8G17_05275 [Gammaproteobacteria bacterium]